MSTLFAETALLPAGWHRNVVLHYDEAGTLVAVRPDADPADHPRAGGAVLPGVPNLHSHAFQWGLAGRAERGQPDGDSFWSWRSEMYRFLAELDPDAVEAIATALYLEMLEAGYTTVVEFHYLHHAPDGRPYDDRAEMALRLGRAAERTGIRLTLVPVVYEAGGFGQPLAPEQGRFRLTLYEALGLLERLEAAGFAHPLGLGLHSLRAVRSETVRDLVEDRTLLARPRTLHMHVAEQRQEVEECVARLGARPIEWLLEAADVDARWCLVHCTHADAAEVTGLARSGAVVALCPTTEANLGDGIFPFAEYERAGGRWGIGSDSHISVDPVEELRWLEYEQRLVTGHRNVLTAGTSRSTGRALVDGALAGGWSAAADNVGRLEPGGRADLIVLDADHPRRRGRMDDALLDAWIFSGGDSAPAHVMVGGRWVVRERRHVERETLAAAVDPVLARLPR
ncbi:MAG: formimidoylglutamate deiminase [Gemmatimonadota bacterium]|nr:formimidoylglutamate deiminase [Gemmatimonadota bacterium]